MAKTGKDIIFEFFYDVPKDNWIAQESLDEAKELLEQNKIPDSLCPFMLGFPLKYEMRGLCYKEKDKVSERKSEDICTRCWKYFLKMQM